ncbi:hypothetical protein [Desulfoluna sp.]|uniref:hypothetical protein n=1 Tax=Desulfoluna sp. TaxID=2045199 RepID=UPI0026327FFC|nr:hypothetical protein [Desulfoluna sp.]
MMLNVSRFFLIAASIGLILTEVPIMAKVLLPLPWEMYGLPIIMLVMGLGLAGFVLTSPLFTRRRKP